MNSAMEMYHRNAFIKELFSKKNNYRSTYNHLKERKILKILFLGHFHRLFRELSWDKIQLMMNYSKLEYYVMDSKIIQLLLKEIIETEEYTLEGIAYYTQIPFDIIYDAASGISNHLSLTPWAKIIDLYLKVKPDVLQILMNKILEIKNKNRDAISTLLCET